MLLERARIAEESQVEILESLEVFPSTLPTKRDSVFAAWVSISVGCNNTCTFCIVPALRGKEKDRRPGDILAEVRGARRRRRRRGDPAGPERQLATASSSATALAFGKLLRACGEIDGLERVRFTSPHPEDFTDDVIAAMAETPNVMPQLHMPLQSGSDRVLKAMRRSYRQEKYLGIIDRVRAAMPDAAITTDIIVGFPGETEEDFARDARRRPPGPVRQRVHVPVLASGPARPPPSCPTSCRRRSCRSATSGCRARSTRSPGRRTSALVGPRRRAAGRRPRGGRKDGATHRLTGRARDNRLVHFAPGDHAVRPGDMVDDRVT